mgnify:CR=1 FL=1
MTDEDLIKITDSMQEKLGADSSALIADDIGLLITGNANSQQALRERDDEIARLKADKEKLIIANGNLLKQVPVEHKNSTEVDTKSEEVTNINIADAFDANGNFKH